MRRKVGLFLVCGVVLPLVVAASASAQGTTLVVDVPNPTPGQAITVTGAFGTTAPASSVGIHLNTRGGRLLTTTAVTSGRISATFPVPPDLAPGWYLLIATQTITANGRSASFAPGRTRINVRAGGGSARGGGGGGGGSSPSPLGLLAVGSALIALAAGATLTVRRLRTLKRPQVGG